jgi:hypothetical protein
VDVACEAVVFNPRLVRQGDRRGSMYLTLLRNFRMGSEYTYWPLWIAPHHERPTELSAIIQKTIPIQLELRDFIASIQIAQPCRPSTFPIPISTASFSA